MEMGNGNDVVMKPCGKTCNQIWSISKIEPGAPKVTSNVSAGNGASPGLVHSHKAGRVLCWILTQPTAHATKAKAVNNTWGRDCDILLFGSSARYPDLNIIELDLGAKESREMLWPKSQQMWMHVYSNYLDKADWFVKADDDTCK